MKILYINSLYNPNLVGGAERVVEKLATTFAQSGHESVVLTTQPHGSAKMSILNDVRVYYMPNRNIYAAFSGARHNVLSKSFWHLLDTYNPWMQRAVEEVIASERPDVVNSHNLAGFSVAAWKAARRFKIPIIHSIHDPYLLCPKSSMFRRERNCGRRCADCFLYSLPRVHATRNVDVVIGVSRFILDQHRHFGLFGQAESRVIYNAVSTTSEVRERGPSRGQVIRYGYLGQLRASKGLHLLIQSLSERPDLQAELWIAGKGDPEYESRLRAHTAGNLQIRWLGHVDNLQAFFGAIDVLAVPSLWNDTAPLVILEAFSYGIPVLGSNRGGIPEFITPDTGWTFDPDVRGDLSASLQTCADSMPMLGRMGNAARRMADSIGNSSRLLEEYASAYEYAFSTRHTADRPQDATSTP